VQDPEDQIRNLSLLNFYPFTRKSLARLKLKALRRGVRLRDLKRKERKILELTIRLVKNVRSFLPAKLVSQIIDKLCEAMERKIFHLMQTEGRSLAEKLSQTCQVLGNKSARSWTNDQRFTQFLTVSNLLSFGKP